MSKQATTRGLRAPTYEGKDVANPFYATTSRSFNQVYEAKVGQQSNYDAPAPVNGTEPEHSKTHKQLAEEGVDWNFMYTASSRQYGTKVEPSDSKLAAAFERQRNSKLNVARVTTHNYIPPPAAATQPTDALEGALDQWEKAKTPTSSPRTADPSSPRFEKPVVKQNPLYSTSSNIIGFKPADQFQDRLGRQGAFTKTFAGGFLSKETGLNTNRTTSKVHDLYDRQFGVVS
jgi:hypothetical protein